MRQVAAGFPRKFFRASLIVEMPSALGLARAQFSGQRIAHRRRRRRRRERERERERE